jgi:anti-sigma B factor antagonist
MRVTIERLGEGVAVVNVEGEVDAHTAGDLDGRLFDLLKAKRCRLAVCLSDVTYISSAGLGAVWRAYQEARRRSGEVRLFAVPENVVKVFAMAGFDEVIPFVDTRGDALRGWEI